MTEPPTRSLYPLFLFVKEWGGVVTVVLALLYTLPAQVWDRIAGHWESAQAKKDRLQTDARNAIARMGVLRMEETDHLIKSQEPDYINQVYSAYDIMIYNVIYTNINLFDEASPYLKSSDLYAIGSSLSLIGEVGESLRFYALALERASSEKRYSIIAPTIFRELGNSLFKSGPYQNVPEARSDYLQALKLLAGDRDARGLFLRFKSELAASEIMFGDYKCGLDLAPALLTEMQSRADAGDVRIRNDLALFSNMLRQSTIRPGQSASGCKDDAPP